MDFMAVGDMSMLKDSEPGKTLKQASIADVCKP